MRGAGGEGEDHHRHHCSTNYIQVREDVKKSCPEWHGGWARGSQFNQLNIIQYIQLVINSIIRI